MNDLVTWDPFRIGASLPESAFRSPIDDGLFNLFPAFVRPVAARVPAAARTDIQEDAQSYRLWIEIPGTTREAIQVSVDGNNVTVSAEIPWEKEAGGEENWLLRERALGRFSRTVVLPEAVDDTAAEAKYRDGILFLRLPKKSSATRLAIH